MLVLVGTTKGRTCGLLLFVRSGTSKLDSFILSLFPRTTCCLLFASARRHNVNLGAIMTGANTLVAPFRGAGPGQPPWLTEGIVGQSCTFAIGVGYAKTY